MVKEGSRQTTLFQSWGCKKKETVVEKVLVPKPSTSFQQDAAVVDLCDSFDDDDDDDELLANAEDTICVTSNASGENNEIHPCGVDSHTGDENVCNISIGAEAFTPTQGQTIPGFDKCAGEKWIYPTNYPVRDYQYNIAQQALFKNTMVTLPTGLGKTFIAAVVMYNFYRWYPQGKIIFMAPTKPLVAQQIEACYNIMGIPQDHTAEMTGSMGPSKREKAWREKRVFFLTPQVLTNDLSRGSCPAELVKCLVIDEAHKALGNHAYCQVVRELVKYTENFRVLALSATPGSDIKAVQQVLSNLLISHIEIRTEESIDIKQYSHERRVDKIVVPLGSELSKVKDSYIHIMDVVVNRLKRSGVLYNRNTTSLSKFLILKAREAFRQNPPERLQRNQYGVVEGDFALAMSLYHGYELLQLHGSRSLYNFLDGILTGDKSYGRTRTELLRNADFNQLMEMLAGKYTTPEGLTASQKAAKPFVTGHPKMEKLQEIVLDHFTTHTDAATRVMIFSQYRDSVQEITDMLLVHRPLVKVMSFIGQASAGKNTKGFTQKEQLKVMKQFREGGYNTLVSTCVGEEGLDIGDVDLIICFDAHKSPIRLVQRMGRTGRKREGRIVMLVTEGKEEQIYNQSQYSKRSIHKAILNGAKSLHFYQHSPRMVPNHCTPTCHKMFITVKENFKPSKKLESGKESKQSKRKESVAANSKTASEDEIITLEEYRELEPWLIPEEEIPKLPDVDVMCLSKENQDNQEAEGHLLSLDRWSPWQTTLQETGKVEHSLYAKHLVQIMEFIQLQQSLDPGDDPYGLEMAAYLNEEDICTEEAAGSSSSILKYCITKQAQNKRVEATKEDSRKCGTGKTRTRLSDALPKFAPLLESFSGSDDDLPKFNMTGNDKSDTAALHRLRSLQNLNNDDINDDFYHLTDGNFRNHIDSSQTDVQKQVINIDKEKEVNENEKENASKMDSKKGGKKVRSKAKSLERKMNEVKIRKRKKSRQNSGQRSVVELLVDSDSGDFDRAGNKPENSVLSECTVISFRHQVLSGEDVQPENELREEIVDDLEVQDCGSENGTFRIRTPPPVEDAVRLCSALDKEISLPEVDLVDLIDEWHREYAEGKYIVWPKKYNQNQSSYSNFWSLNQNRSKMSVSEIDISVHSELHGIGDISDLHGKATSSKHTLQIDRNNSCFVKDSEMFEKETQKDSYESELGCKLNVHILEDDKSNTISFGKKFALPLEKENNSKKASNTTKKIESCDIHKKDVHDEFTADKTSDDEKAKVQYTSARDGQTHAKSIALDRSVEQVKAVEEDVSDDEWMNTGTFALDLDIGDDIQSPGEQFIKDISFDKDDVEVSAAKGFAENAEEKRRETAETVDNDKLKTNILACTQEAVQPGSNVSSNRQTLFDFICDANLSESELGEDGNFIQKPLTVPFSKPDFKLSDEMNSWPSDDMDDEDHVFVDQHTQASKPCQNTSTQITFSQALDFVHNSPSGTESKDKSQINALTLSDNQLKSKINKSYVLEVNKSDLLLEHSDDNLEEFVGVDKPHNKDTEPKVWEDTMHQKRPQQRKENVTDDSLSFTSQNLQEPNILSADGNIVAASGFGVDLPMFDLGFDIDDDVIPPSPELKQSQKSAARLSQAFNLTNKLSQGKFSVAYKSDFCSVDKNTSLEDASSNKMGGDEKNDYNKNKHKILKSRRSLELDRLFKTEEVIDEQRSESPESQSLLDNHVNNDEPAEKMIALNNERSCLNVIPENGQVTLNSSEKQTNIVEKEIRQFTKDPKTVQLYKDTNMKKSINSDTSVANFESSFSLLVDNELLINEQIDSDARIVNNRNEDSLRVKYSESTWQGEHCLIGNSCRKTPVAAVAPVGFENVKENIHLCAVESSKSNWATSECREVDTTSYDFSEDFLNDDSFELPTAGVDRSDCVRTLNTNVNQKHQHKTSTPFGKTRPVTPFLAKETSPVQPSPSKSKTHRIHGMDSRIIRKDFQNEPLSDEHDVSTESGNNNQCSFKDIDHLTDDDSFCVVRKKKKLAVLDSPSSQNENFSRTKEDRVASDHETSLIGARQKRTIERKESLVEIDNECDDNFDDSFMFTQNNYIVKNPSAPCRNLVNSESEDDFEKVVAKPKPTAMQFVREGIKANRKGEKIKPVVPKKRTSNPFIDAEAEISESEEDDFQASSDEDEGIDLDQYENSFIHDSQFCPSQAMNNTDAHALYLKSVKSPVANRGGFKLQFAHRDIDVFSQAPQPEESQYMEDSFCVGSDPDDEWMLREDEHDGDVTREISLLKRDNSFLPSGRRKRKKGATSFLTSRQREIHQGRMKALDKIRAKLSRKDNTEVNTSRTATENCAEKINTKKRRIQTVLNSSSEDDCLNITVSGNKSTNKAVVEPVSAKDRKRARLLISGDESESEDFCEARNVNKCSEVSKTVILEDDGAKDDEVVPVNNRLADDKAKLERLKRQKEMQEQFRQQIVNKTKLEYESNCLTSIKEKLPGNNLQSPLAYSYSGPSEMDVGAVCSRSAFPKNPVILVDSKELSGSQDIISDLRFKHRIQVCTAQLAGCDYIVSNRMAVDRKQWAEFSNGANRAKMIERMQHLGELYDRPCLIIEKDRVKTGEEKNSRPLHWTKYVDRTLAMLLRSEVKVLFTDNSLETASLLADLCRLEQRKNMGISVSVDLSTDDINKVKFFLSLPRVTYVQALNLCHGYRSVSEFIKSTVPVIQSRGKMSSNRATEICNYIHRQFDTSMLPAP